jgi:hypothetical protein
VTLAKRRRMIVGLMLAAIVAMGTVLTDRFDSDGSVRIDGITVPCSEAIVVGVRESGSPLGTQRNFGLCTFHPTSGSVAACISRFVSIL